MYHPGMGQALASFSFFRREPVIVEKKTNIEILMDGAELALLAEKEPSGPVEGVFEEMCKSIDQYKQDEEHLKRRIQDLNERLRQTQVTLAALEAAQHILHKDIMRD